jgi:2-phospho-L-lactate guanylyltransferase
VKTASTSRQGIWALVPIKRMQHSKSRLSGVLDPVERKALARAMLCDVLAALGRVETLAGILVVTDDADATSIATSCGASVLADPVEAGLNEAVLHGMRHLDAEGRAGVIVVPADIPFVTPAEFAAVLSAMRYSPVVAVPATRDGGTNILAASPPALLTPAFGRDSFARHVAAAHAFGIEPQILSLNGAGHDIDTAADLDFHDCKGPAKRTRAQLGRFVQTGLPAQAGPIKEVSLP